MGMRAQEKTIHSVHWVPTKRRSNRFDANARLVEIKTTNAREIGRQQHPSSNGDVFLSPGCSKWGGRSSFPLFPRLFSGLSLALCFRHWIMKYSSCTKQTHTNHQRFNLKNNLLIYVFLGFTLHPRLPRCQSSVRQRHGWARAAPGRWPPGPGRAAGLRCEAHSCSSPTRTVGTYKEGLRLNAARREES